MAYDFAGSWSSKSGHHAQLYPDNPHESSGSTAVEYLINRGFPPAKILLGVPVYGRSFLGATGPGQNFTGNGGDEGTFEYKSLPREGANEQTDTRLVAAYGIGGDGGFVSYDTPETVKIKGAYCREKRLGVSSPPITLNPKRERKMRDSDRKITDGEISRDCSIGREQLIFHPGREVSSLPAFTLCMYVGLTLLGRGRKQTLPSDSKSFKSSYS